MRWRRSLTVVAAWTALLTLAAGAPAMTPHATLSRAEYQQLRLAQSRIKTLESADARHLRRAKIVCTQMRPVSRLIGAVRRGCLDLIRLGGDDAKLNARATKCGIDPSSELAILSCLVPAVQRYHADAESFYRAESYVNRLARTRGFTSTCVAVIGDSPANVAAEDRLAHDLASAVKALESQDPGALQTLSGQIQATVRAIKPGPTSLSVCQHA